MMSENLDPYAVPAGDLKPVGGTRVAACYQCGSEQGDLVKFTWWGGILGPRLLKLAKCRGCGSANNFKTGQSVRRKIWIYMAVTWVLAGLAGYFAVRLF